MSIVPVYKVIQVHNVKYRLMHANQIHVIMAHARNKCMDTTNVFVQRVILGSNVMFSLIHAKILRVFIMVFVRQPRQVLLHASVPEVIQVRLSSGYSFQ